MQFSALRSRKYKNLQIFSRLKNNLMLKLFLFLSDQFFCKLHKNRKVFKEEKYTLIIYTVFSGPPDQGCCFLLGP